jgi:quercetin dioxygenase-like cupin family protein
MKVSQLKVMTRGWFVGNFDPSCLRTDSCKAACKTYHAGETESRHVHKVATEITLIVSGKVMINNTSFQSGDIVMLEPGEPGEFHALEDTITMVVKVPSVLGDKYRV